MEDNSRFLVRATVKKLFGPTLFSGIMGAMSPILGCFLLAAFADDKSMVAASLFFPIYTLWNICGFGVGIGGSTMFSHYKGAGDNEGANTVFHKALFTIIAMGIFFGLLPFVNLKMYVDLLGSSAEIFDLAFTQAIWICAATPFNMIFWAMFYFVRSDSNPELASIAATVETIVEVAVDFVCIAVFKLGAISVAIGVMIGYLVSILSLWPHFRSKDASITLGLTRPSVKDIIDFYKNSLSDSLEQLLIPVASIVFNNLVLKYLGLNVMAVWAVLSTCQSLDRGFITGVNSSFVPIIGTFYGEKNGNAIYTTLKTGVKRLLAVSLFEFAIYFIFTYQIVNLFSGGLAKMEHMCFIAIRSYVFCLPFAFFNSFVISSFQATEHMFASGYLSIMRNLILPVFFGAAAILKRDAADFWYAYLYAELALLVLIIILFPLLTTLKHCKLSVREFFSFDNDYKGELNMLLRGGFDELQGYQDLTKVFLKHQGLEAKTTKISLIMEEVLSYLTSHGFKTKAGNYVDYNIYVRNDNSIFMRIRSNSQYLKLSKMQELVSKAEVGELLELRMLVGLADKIDTSKINGLNSITLEV